MKKKEEKKKKAYTQQPMGPGHRAPYQYNTSIEILGVASVKKKKITV